MLDDRPIRQSDSMKARPEMEKITKAAQASLLGAVTVLVLYLRRPGQFAHPYLWERTVSTMVVGQTFYRGRILVGGFAAVSS
jgi:hypothetical protein